MRVALVHLRHGRTGGTERHLNQIAAHLAERGDEVTIVCRSHEEAPHPNVRFTVLRSAAPGAAWRMWAFARDVERHIAASSYDVVYALGRTWTHDAIRLGGGCHRTYLELAHAATQASWERWIGRGRLKQRVALALEARGLAPGAYRRVVVNSEMVKNDVMRRHAVPAEKIEVIYNGVDLERFHPRRHRAQAADLRRACGLGADDFVVLFLGSGYARKGLGPLLPAFAAMSARSERARLLVVGYDSAQRAFERQAAHLGIAAKTRFIGGRRDAEACYAAADLYVLPSLYDPFANSTLEALASGLPVITTTTNGGHEVVAHRQTGSVVEAAAALPLIEELEFWSSQPRPIEACRALAAQFPQERAASETAAMLDSIRLPFPPREGG
jgi:UDP-glucose:(heptosyl)LPS alpha-1,3-glucosyltransferase